MWRVLISTAQILSRVSEVTVFLVTHDEGYVGGMTIADWYFCLYFFKRALPVVVDGAALFIVKIKQ